jgi:hypothetical protein
MQKVLWEMAGLLLMVMLMGVWESYMEVLQSQWQAAPPKTKRRWSLKARTPHDCQDCRLARWDVLRDGQRTARPWNEVKLWRILLLSRARFLTVPA